MNTTQEEGTRFPRALQPWVVRVSSDTGEGAIVRSRCHDTHTASRGNQLLWVLPTPLILLLEVLSPSLLFPSIIILFMCLVWAGGPHQWLMMKAAAAAGRGPSLVTLSLSLSFSLCWSDARSEKHLQTTTLWLSLSPSGQNQILGSSAQTQPLLVSSGKIHKVGIYGRHKQAAEIQGLLHWQFQQLAYCSDN